VNSLTHQSSHYFNIAMLGSVNLSSVSYSCYLSPDYFIKKWKWNYYGWKVVHVKFVWKNTQYIIVNQKNSRFKYWQVEKGRLIETICRITKHPLYSISGILALNKERNRYDRKTKPCSAKTRTYRCNNLHCDFTYCFFWFIHCIRRDYVHQLHLSI
jgi:hypothetical protein